MAWGVWETGAAVLRGKDHPFYLLPFVAFLIVLLSDNVRQAFWGPALGSGHTLASPSPAAPPGLAKTEPGGTAPTKEPWTRGDIIQVISASIGAMGFFTNDIRRFLGLSN